MKTKISAGLILAALGTVFLSGVICAADDKPEYVCRRAAGAIVIDGKLDEEAWKRADMPWFYVPETKKTPISRTEAKVLWDDDYLYVVYRAFDKDVWSTFTKRDDLTCQEDCLECFIQPDPSKPNYYNFEINALGTILDAYSLRKLAGGYMHHRWGPWNCEGLKVGITVDGTLNDPSDVDKAWQMEIAIPFAELPSLNGKRPKPGDVWNFLLARYDYSVYLEEGVELSCSAPIERVDFHETSQWGRLKFSE